MLQNFVKTKQMILCNLPKAPIQREDGGMMRAGLCPPFSCAVTLVTLFYDNLYITEIYTEIYFIFFSLFIIYKITSQSSQQPIFACISTLCAVTLFFSKSHRHRETVDISRKIP